jgi:hypothetical protein
MAETQKEKDDAAAAEELRKLHALNGDALFNEFLENFGFVVLDAKCGVVDLEFLRTTGGLRIMQLATFHSRYVSLNISDGQDASGKEIWIPVTKKWYASKLRKNFDGITYQPPSRTGGGPPVEDNILNLWRGLSPDLQPIECLKGMTEDGMHADFPWTDYHLKEILCASDEGSYECLLNWMAHAMQYPGEKPGFGIFLQSTDEGTGKGIGGEFIMKIQFGAENFIRINNSQELLGEHNKHLANKIITFADESFFVGNKDDARKLKNFITQETIRIRPLYFDSFEVPSYHRVIASTNDLHHIRAHSKSRRYLVLKVSNIQARKNLTYFKPLKLEIRNEASYFKWFLLHRNIEDFDIFSPYVTDALREQAAMSKDAHEEWWSNGVREGRFTYDDPSAVPGALPTTTLVLDLECKDNPLIAQKRLIFQSYRDHAKRTANTLHLLNESALGVFLKEKGVVDHEVRRAGVPRRWYNFTAVRDGLKNGEREENDNL